MRRDVCRYLRSASQPTLKKIYTKPESKQKSGKASRHFALLVTQTARRATPAHASTISTVLPRTASE